MPSNSEMYERGISDAEQDDLNLFYYQHYYYYRKGYDEMRRRLRREVPGAAPRQAAPLLIAIALAVVAALGGWYWLAGRSVPTIAAAPPTDTPLPARPTPEPTIRLRPTPTTAPPTATPVPTLAIGVRVRAVNLSGAPLRARVAPGLTRIVARIPEGSVATIIEGPVQADGYTWWRLQAEQGSGWCAEGSPDGELFLAVVP